MSHFGFDDDIEDLAMGGDETSGLIDQAWRDLLEKDDRTSPAEYPDMVLISHDELALIVFSATGRSNDRDSSSDWVIPIPLALNKHTAKLVLDFATALSIKLRLAEEKYGYSDDWRTNDSEADFRRALIEHVTKGDPLDVAAYAAFCWARGWRTSVDGCGLAGQP